MVKVSQELFEGANQELGLSDHGHNPVLGQLPNVARGRCPHGHDVYRAGLVGALGSVALQACDCPKQIPVLHLMPRHPVLQHVDRAPLEDEESVGLRSLHYDVLTWEDEQDVHSFGDRTDDRMVHLHLPHQVPQDRRDQIRNRLRPQLEWQHFQHRFVVFAPVVGGHPAARAVRHDARRHVIREVAALHPLLKLGDVVPELRLAFAPPHLLEKARKLAAVEPKEQSPDEHRHHCDGLL
mmetsp:Transcript_1176/g.4745  ORF Transcript_1176/g.4745 Transcript_1176/m.4745 type:complete len:238 (+) Transcript_1176:881-1594(+)